MKCSKCHQQLDLTTIRDRINIALIIVYGMCLLCFIKSEKAKEEIK